MRRRTGRGFRVSPVSKGEDARRPDALVPGSTGVVRLPSLVRGCLVWPDPSPSGGGAGAGTDQTSFVVGPDGASAVLAVPRVDPEALVERDLDALASSVYATSTAELSVLLAELQVLLRPDGDLALAVTEALGPVVGPRRAWRVVLAMLPQLFEPEAVLAMVRAELRHGELDGAALLDGWVEVPGPPRAGPTMLLAARVLDGGTPPAVPAAWLRAVPTRQLHLTSANSPLVGALSVQRALATRGAATVKVSLEQAGTATLLALALARLAPRHAAARHLSLVYWRGGDRAVEDVLLADGSYDRVVVWGGAEATRSVRTRTATRTVSFGPRVGMSLVGREAFEQPRALAYVAAAAAADSLVEDQTACSSSLVHYVEADEEDALRYCRALHEALGRWDDAVPSRPVGASRAALWRLRREDLVGGTWFTHGDWPDVVSSVVLAPHTFDLSSHPAGRCVVVRRVDDLTDALNFVDSSVSTVGIYPDARWRELRDRVAARGTTTVAPLGRAERFWAGQPHDGMRVLDELVSWATS